MRHMSAAERAANDRELAAAAPGYRPRGGGRGRRGQGRGQGRPSSLEPRPDLPNDLHAPTQRLQYHRVMREFMDYKKERVHATDTVFTE